MKIHLQALELFIGGNGKVKYRHKRIRQFGTHNAKALCGKNSSAYTVEVPDWYEYKASEPGLLCQHCVQSLKNQKRSIKAA
jgi:hypothetical protein